MLQRSMWNQLTEWKGKRHHPLILRGMRQTGKTFLVREFGKQFYENVIYLDLRQNQTIHSVFDGDFDVDQMTLLISANESSARFVPGKTLLIFDEIQDCPNARSSLKYWDLDGRYDVIGTGSFLGVKGFRKPYPRGIPVGYEEELTMHPLSFREFLINSGMQDNVLSYVEKCLTERQPLAKTVHESMRSLYYVYLIVGGMPEAVNAYFESHDTNQIQSIQRRIIQTIRDDFGRYRMENGEEKVNETLKLRAEACLDSVPNQLAKEYKKFQYSLVDLKAHSVDKADGVQYLDDVGLIIRAYNLREISAPLEANRISSEYKAYYSDTGLLVSQLDDGTAARILNGDLSAYKGAVAENAVACALADEDQKLYYYHAPSGSPELDFIWNRMGEPTIIECKASRTRATSMKYVISHPQKYGRHPAVKFADTNVGGGDGFVTLPLYALGFLHTKPAKTILPEVNVHPELPC